ncbi:hypothetical protein DFA_06808 [Cavenderia fasciculata]|uniref:Ankyrin repeat-containing protein n=1 Tax=Cavenderia fasciculata TaxID=261658 RepID=F4Q2C1_CACFS|nr:uncharacterized protein DFA_06808 [Cavenderia fasciculata]EGG18141.1 hypothetical protein DFA_06808 [Cavenderia fasciculata]|eukprot:XP_004366182.1 hypothetical protein DFA_06808 [Cavenderia fasciculata]
MEKNEKAISSVFKSIVLFRHILSFISSLSSIELESLKVRSVKFKDASSHSISYLSLCHHDHLKSLVIDSLSNYSNKHSILATRIKQRDNAFKLLIYKLNNNSNNNNNNCNNNNNNCNNNNSCNSNEFILHFRALPRILRQCKDVTILDKIYNQYRHYFRHQLVVSTSPMSTAKSIPATPTTCGDCVGSKSWVLDNVAASGNFACFVYVMDRIGVVPTVQTVEMACEYGSLQILDYLHESYPEVGIGRSFELASVHPHLDVIQFLIDNKTEGYSITTLAHIAVTPCIDVATLLLSNTKNRLVDDKTDDRYKHIVDLSVVSGSAEMVRLFYTHFGRDRISASALDRSAELGYLDIVQYLSEEVIAPFTSDAKEYSAKNGHLQVVKYLVERSLPLEQPWTCKGAINKAAAAGHLDIVQYLLTTGHQCDSLAMHHAAINGHLEVVHFLKDNTTHGCKIDTAAQVCSVGKGDYCAMVSFILKEYPIKFKSSQEYRNTIKYAAQRGDIELYKIVVELLDFNREKNGYNPLPDETMYNRRGGGGEGALELYRLVAEQFTVFNNNNNKDTSSPSKPAYQTLPFWHHLLPPFDKPDLRLWLLVGFSHILTKQAYTQILLSSVSAESLETLEAIHQYCPDVFTDVAVCLHLSKIACSNDRVEVLEFIHQRGMLSVFSHDQLIYIACTHESFKCLAFFKQHSRIQLSHHGEPLIKPSLEIVQFLWANMPINNETVRFYFYDAINRGNYEIVQFIVNNNIEQLKELFAAVDRNQPTTPPPTTSPPSGTKTLPIESPIDWATISGHIELVEYFSEKLPFISPTKIAFTGLQTHIIQQLVHLYPTDYSIIQLILNQENPLKKNNQNNDNIDNNNNQNNNNIDNNNIDNNNDLASQASYFTFISRYFSKK